jgi:D-alanyl-D-alanine carboxypeptidase
VKRFIPMFLLVLTACVPIQPPAATAPAPVAAVAPAQGAPDEAALDAILTQWTSSIPPLCDAPGGVLLVDSPAGRYLKAAGLASTENPRPVEVGDRFEIGSNTKAFTVILALQLQEEGLISMDDPLSDYLPKVAARLPNGDEVTLRQMAGNVSGIRDYADLLMQPRIDANDQVAIAQSWTPEELVDFAIDLGEPEFAPGEGWQYSSTNFILLGMVVEAVTGQPLAELYQQRIFEPLGMVKSETLTGSPAAGSIVDGYYTIPSGELANMTGWNGSQGGAAGAIVSTAEDMARFAKGLFAGELFQSDATLQEMLAMRDLTLEEGGGLFQGYSLGLISFGTPGFESIGHGGATPGFQSIWLHAPASDVSVVFLTNSGTCRVLALPNTLTPEMLGLQGDGS